MIEWDGYDLKDNTWEEEGNIYSEETINAFHTACRRQFRTKFKLSTLTTTTRKLLLRSTYDPDTDTYTSQLKKVTTKNSETILADSKKRTRELIETETESVTVSKPVKEVKQYQYISSKY